MAINSPTRRKYLYRLTEADIIDYVDSWWLAFASENNAAELKRSSVVGHSIWDFIADRATQNLYREIHGRVREFGHSILVPFRCDSPTLQRHMQLTISQEPNGYLLYESTLVRATQQKRMALLDSKQQRSDEFLTMCSFCKRSLIEPSGWLEMEDIAIKLRMYEQPTVPALRYTVCPDCESRSRNRP